MANNRMYLVCNVCEDGQFNVSHLRAHPLPLLRCAKGGEISNTPYLDECNANYRARVAREEAEERRVLGLEARIRELEAAIKSANSFIECLRGNPPGDYVYECLGELRDVTGSGSMQEKDTP